MRSHTGEKPFKCAIPTCGRSFSRSYDLTKHKELHSGSHKYRCAFEENGSPWGCGKGFHKKGDLHRHLRRDNAAQCRQATSAHRGEDCRPGEEQVNVVGYGCSHDLAPTGTELQVQTDTQYEQSNHFPKLTGHLRAGSYTGTVTELSEAEPQGPIGETANLDQNQSHAQTRVERQQAKIKSILGACQWQQQPRILCVGICTVTEDFMCTELRTSGCVVHSVLVGTQPMAKVREAAESGHLRYDLIFLDHNLLYLEGIPLQILLLRQFLNTSVITHSMSTRPRLKDDIGPLSQKGLTNVLPIRFRPYDLVDMLKKHLKHLMPAEGFGEDHKHVNGNNLGDEQKKFINVKPRKEDRGGLYSEPTRTIPSFS